MTKTARARFLGEGKGAALYMESSDADDALYILAKRRSWSNKAPLLPDLLSLDSGPELILSWLNVCSI